MPKLILVLKQFGQWSAANVAPVVSDLLIQGAPGRLVRACRADLAECPLSVWGPWAVIIIGFEHLSVSYYDCSKVLTA